LVEGRYCVEVECRARLDLETPSEILGRFFFSARVT